jgi:hypothetical protein
MIQHVRSRPRYGRRAAETLFGHIKGEWPHLEKIRDPRELEAELERSHRVQHRA